jgi:hypothetical protein
MLKNYVENEKRYVDQVCILRDNGKAEGLF